MRIQAGCPTCGRVEVSRDDVELVVGRSDESRNSYAFTCPVCGVRIVKPADATVVKLLVQGGVRVREPVDASHPERVAPAWRDAPAFTRDDLLDFHQLLASEHWLDALQKLESQTRHPSWR